MWNDEEVMSNHYNTCVYRRRPSVRLRWPTGSGAELSLRRAEDQKGQVGDERFGCGTMILADGKLIVLTEKGDLYLVKATPEGYTELAKMRLFDAGPCRAQIALAGSRLFARDQKRLVCVELMK